MHGIDSTFIIAEAGINHNGDVGTAKKLIVEAKKVGADAVKFQSFKAELLVSKKQDQKQYELMKSFELSFDQQKELYDFAQEQNIQFLSSCFDKESVDFLKSLGLTMVKVASSELTNYPLLKYIAEKDLDIILSTGMSTLEEVAGAVEYIRQCSDVEIVVLHCVSSYPTEPKEVNLGAMEAMEIALQCGVGFSDHTLGIAIPIAAATLGASILEKHFTLDKNMEGPDQALSADPVEFKQMVDSIRQIHKAFGDGIKRPTEKEEKVKFFARKSLFTLVDIKAGDILKEEMFTAKRPGKGISPKDLDKIVGKKAIRDLAEDEIVHWDLLMQL